MPLRDCDAGIQSLNCENSEWKVRSPVATYSRMLGGGLDAMTETHALRHMIDRAVYGSRLAKCMADQRNLLVP